MTSSNPKVVIIGSGPTGLGAAYRLQELGHKNFVVLDQATRAGGLARSDVDEEGFYWDYGGHVVFSHYEYFDKVLDNACPDWVSHQREAWVWMRDRWVPYPFQNNIQRLPEEDLSKCVKGLLNKETVKNPDNFSQWLQNGFGEGIMVRALKLVLTSSDPFGSSFGRFELDFFLISSFLTLVYSFKPHRTRSWCPTIERYGDMIPRR